MSAFDSIIGYSDEKRELMQICDILKNGEEYAKLGVKPPKGLFLYGVPGVGKTLMAMSLIEESGRKTYTCRKDKPNDDFIKEIKSTFEVAKRNAPSIVFLDDMDKFANSDNRHPNAEEYVTVQSCIDGSKGFDVFVLATANDEDDLPRSLLRVGRFDRRIEVDTPKYSDSIKIIEHYLSNKKLDDDIDIENIAKIMDGRSCAALETVINEAGIFAGYERKDKISMDHIIKSCMKIIFDVHTDLFTTKQISGTTLKNGMPNEIIYHEIGHAVISEVLSPESVTIISAYSKGSKGGGFTSYWRNHSNPTTEWIESRIIAALGGKAMTEQKFGILDSGAGADIDHAINSAKKLIIHYASMGVALHGLNNYDDSPELLAKQEQVVAGEIERYYRKAKEILAKNSEFVEKLASALNEKGYLSMTDIKVIKDKCTIVNVAV